MQTRANQLSSARSRKDLSALPSFWVNWTHTPHFCAAIRARAAARATLLLEMSTKKPKLQAVKSFLGKAPRKQLATKAVRVQPPANILDDLDEALRNVEQPGAFASCDHFSDLPSIPLLRVDGLDEPVALPLPAAQARELVSIAQKAAFGRGEDTVVDENVRKAWKIPGARCRFDNAAWAPALSRLVERARQELGVVPRVRAELHDLLVYEAGGFFAPHKDSEKAPGMFGTLVVTLPSTHSGGALEVRHDGDTVRFASGEGTLTEAGWCAFYADCEHEILRVESGYRVALTYNLLRGGEGPAPAPPSQKAAAASLRTFAARWTAGKDYGRGVPAKLCKFLDHEYTETSIQDGWSCLKGDDAALAEALHESGAFDVYLCVAKHEEHGDAECMEVHDCSTTFEGWVPHEDANVPFECSDLTVEEREYTDQDHFSGIDPYEEDGGYPTGNEGCPYSKWYRAAAFVFWPKARRVPVIGLNGAIDLLGEALDGDASAHAGYASPGAMAEACVVDARRQSPTGESLEDLVCCLARDGVDASVLINFVGDSLMLAYLGKHWEGGGRFAGALSAARDRFGADDASRLDAAIGKAMQRGATSKDGARVAWLILGGFTKAPGASAAQVVAAVGDVLVQSLAVTFPLPDVKPPSYSYGDVAAKTATYIAEQKAKLREVAAKAATATLSAALEALTAPHAPAALLAATASAVCANAARFDGISVVPAAVAPFLGGREKRGALSPPAIAALETMAAAAMTARAPTRDTMSAGRCEALLVTLAATGGAGRRAALFDNQPWDHVAKASSAILSDASRAPGVHGDASLSRVLLAAIARGKAVAPAPQSSYGYRSSVFGSCGSSPSSPVLEVPRDALVNAFLALRAVERRCALAEANAAQSALDELAAIVARTAAFDPLRAVVPAVEKLMAADSGLDAAGRDSAALGALYSLGLAPLRAAARPPPPLKDWKMSVKLATHGSWKFREAEEFFADPLRDSTQFTGVEATYNGALTLKLIELSRSNGFTVRRISSKAARVNGRIEVTKTKRGQAPVAELRKRRTTEKQRAKDVATLRTYEALKPQLAAAVAPAAGAGDEPPKKKQRSKPPADAEVICIE